MKDLFECFRDDGDTPVDAAFGAVLAFGKVSNNFGINRFGNDVMYR